jgi:hypothetical protein
MRDREATSRARRTKTRLLAVSTICATTAGLVFLSPVPGTAAVTTTLPAGVSSGPSAAAAGATAVATRASAVATPATAAATHADAAAALATAATTPTRATKATTTTATVVPPHVTETAIPAVGASAAGTVAGSTASTEEAAPGRLAAHVRVRTLDPFSMLGVTWAAGSGDEITVLVRTRAATGWGDWVELHADADDGDPARYDDAGRDGTQALWVDTARGVEVSVYTTSGSSPRDLEVSTIDPGRSSYDATATSTAAQAAQRPRAGTFPGIPAIITRRQWGADPRLGDQCWPPRYGRAFKAVFVHHTVTSNDYDEAESASVVRGIYAYHTQSRGWCDIGYNFLVDRYGNVFEGRRGGIRHPVRGAHAGDYNTNSTGISLMGEFEEGYPTKRMKGALVQLVAWRLGTAYHGAYGKAFIYDERFKRISGHRDAMATACPGAHVYEWLPQLRKRVRVRLGDYESAIESRWREEGAGRGWLGTVRVGEQRVPGGRLTVFQRGRIFASPMGERAYPSGPILSRYNQLRGPVGPLGFPLSAIRPVAGDGTRAIFAGGRIWWSHATAAHELPNGPIMRRYLHVHSAAGPLGFPRTSPFATLTGTRVNFQHGYITWTRSTGRTAVELR